MRTAALLALLAASPAAEPACSVAVEYGSYCCGVDGATKAKIEAYLATDRGVAASSVQAWGREGENTRCITTRSAADTTRIFARVSGMIPAKAQGGWVRVRTDDGRTSRPQTQANR